MKVPGGFIVVEINCFFSSLIIIGDCVYTLPYIRNIYNIIISFNLSGITLNTFFLPKVIIVPSVIVRMGGLEGG